MCKQKTTSDESNSSLKMNQDNLILKSEDRVLFIINDNTIHGDTRFQKYGFLLYKQYSNELKKLKNNFPEFNFYDDWEPYHYGPYSKQLNKDIKICIEDKILIDVKMDGTTYSQYKLTLKGRKKWRSIFNTATDEIIGINNKIRNLQGIKFIELLRQVYNAYPEYTIKSRIKDTLD